MNIDVTEVKALSGFLALEEDMKELIQIETYFMGCRRTIQFLILAAIFAKKMLWEFQSICRSASGIMETKGKT